ncbi:ribonuclease III [Cutaneotrichosporon oleaginosum]|uniref:Ribonuclease III n=1 Tax=Cutaneotrichosporon oleaginosum TaxID=879819 RepID=A0A0J0XRQ5_9TREE|nr:ribonuclease III [Cutaneotrichosporon oleaginosum]KLT43811.1 ribonuclease III [Cutaneotrichosporon oleaginosum]TXT06447.1 hypothetical protein COLE_05778 [Cutaneotrichosporon oleaginosum]
MAPGHAGPSGVKTEPGLPPPPRNPPRDVKPHIPPDTKPDVTSKGKRKRSPSDAHPIPPQKDVKKPKKSKKPGKTPKPKKTAKKTKQKAKQKPSKKEVAEKARKAAEEAEKAAAEKAEAKKADAAKSGTLVFREPLDITPPRSLTLDLATSVLSEYVGSLRNNLAIHGLEWSYREHSGTFHERGFTATVELPFNSPARTAKGDRQISKKLARASAAMVAVKELMRYGEIGLDFTLTPLHPGHDGRKDPKPASDPVNKIRPYTPGPQWWADTPRLDAAELYGSVIKLEIEEFPAMTAKCRPLLLVTSRPLPFDGSRFDVSGSKVVAFARLSASFPLKIRPKDLDRAVAFSTALFSGVCHRHITFKHHMARYLILPLKWEASVTTDAPLTRDHITWGEVVDACNNPLQPLHYRNYDELKAQCEGRVICGTPTSIRWEVRGVRDDLRPSSSDNNKCKYGDLSKGVRKSRGYDSGAVVTDSEQPLLDVEAAIRSNVTGVISNLEGESIRRELVLPELLRVHSISAGTFRTASILHTFFAMLNAQLLGMEMSKALFGGRIKPHLAREALTTSQARPVPCQQDYQRVEMLGDSALRLAVVCLVYCDLSDPDESGVPPNEGALVKAGNEIQKNSTLMSSAEKAGITPYIRGVYTAPTDWVPLGWAPSPTPPKVQELGNKILADTTEALIGATLLSAQEHVLEFLSNKQGLELVLATMRDLQIPAPNATWGELRGLSLPVTVRQQLSSQPLSVLGYTFKDPAKGHLALSAASRGVIFDRYEHVGDALIGFMAMLHLWNDYPQASNAALTNAKQSRVSNAALTAFLVSSGLMKILTGHTSAAGDVDTVAAGLFQAQTRTDLLPADQQSCAYWDDVPTSKFLADHVEALFGAILDDSDFDPAPAMRLYTTHMAPFMRRYARTPSEGGNHPHAQLQMILGKRNCWALKKENEIVKSETDNRRKFIVTGEWRLRQADAQ